MALILPQPTSLDRYSTAAKDAGCPRDQIGNFIRAGIVLQPKQLRASAMARMCDDPSGPTELGYGGARGGGKSHWLMAQLYDDCIRRPGLKCLLLRKVGKANRENFQDLRSKVLGAVPCDYNRAEGILRFANGSLIILGHFKSEGDIDNYLGLEYDVIGVEEATTLTSTKYKAIHSCLRTSKADWRPRMYSTTNPGGVGHAWYKAKFIQPMRAGREHLTRFIQATADDNACLNPEYVRDVLESFVGWQYKAWRLGDWDIAAGQYFTNWYSPVHVRSIVPQPGWKYWASLDHGFTHFTAMYLLAQDHDGNNLVLDEHAERGKLPPWHATQMQALLDRNSVAMGQLWKFVAGGDVWNDRGGYTVASQYAECGIRLTRADDGPGSRIQGASHMLSLLGDNDQIPPIEPRLFVSEKCARLIDCIPSLEHDPHRPEDVLKADCDEEGLGGDDPYDSTRYGLMANWGQSGKPASSSPKNGLTMPNIARAQLVRAASPLARHGSPFT